MINLLLPKSKFVKLFLRLFLILANIFLWAGMPHGWVGVFPRKEGGLQVLTGLAPQKTNTKILIKNPLASFADPKSTVKKF